MGKKAYIGVQNFEPRNLPSGYTQVEYIQSSGTQYIDTGFAPKGTSKVECEFQMVSQSTSQQGVFGSRPGTSGRFTVFTGSGTTDLQVDYDTEQTLATVGTAITGLNVNKKTKIEVSNSLVINGTTVATVTAASFTSAYNLFLFANNNAGTAQLPSAMMLYSCRIYDNGILVRDFVPCTNSAGTAGLYEMVSGTFYQNAGSDTFTAGDTLKSVAKKAKKIYVGVDGVAKKVKRGYIGIDGVARQFFSSGELSKYGTVTALSTTRQWLAGASVGDYALFAGGYYGSSLRSTVDAYNKLLVKSTASSLLTGRYNLAGASVGDYALFAGGNAGSYQKIVCAYSSSLVRTQGTSLYVEREELAGASVGNYALFAGGYNGSSSSVVDAYNSSLTRSTATALSEARCLLAGASVGDYALFAGGNSTSSVVDAYNASLVRSTPTALSAARYQLAGASVGNYALFAGGYDIFTPYMKTVDAYSSSLVRSTPTALSTARNKLAGASVGDYALFAGGYTGSSSKVVNAYDKSLVRSTPTALSTARYDLAGASVGDYALFAGGNSGSGYSNVVEAYTVA